ncbi:MAG: zinc ribbon domain-containing protein, partial [Deferribacterales bacterium]
MPIYEYKCKKCGHLFELLEVSYNNVRGTTCVKCGSQAERIISLSS